MKQETRKPETSVVAYVHEKDTSNESIKIPDEYNSENQDTTVSESLNRKSKEMNSQSVNINELYSKNYPNKDRTVKLSLTPEDIANDAHNKYKLLSQYNGEYIRIKNYEVNKLENAFHITNNGLMCDVYLSSLLKKEKFDFNENPYVIDLLYMDYTDTTTANYKLNKGDKITIEGKLVYKRPAGDFYSLSNTTPVSIGDGTTILFENCRIVK